MSHYAPVEGLSKYLYIYMYRKKERERKREREREREKERKKRSIWGYKLEDSCHWWLISIKYEPLFHDVGVNERVRVWNFNFIVMRLTSGVKNKLFILHFILLFSPVFEFSNNLIILLIYIYICVCVCVCVCVGVPVV